MTKIPAKIRRVLENMPRMKQCELKSDREVCPCEGKIEYHHVWIYAGKQIQEVWAILGVCKVHHDQVNKYIFVKEKLEHRSLEIATDTELSKYPKFNWIQKKKYLCR